MASSRVVRLAAERAEDPSVSAAARIPHRSRRALRLRRHRRGEIGGDRRPRRDRLPRHRTGPDHQDRSSFERRDDELSVLRDDRDGRGCEDSRTGVRGRAAAARVALRVGQPHDHPAAHVHQSDQAGDHRRRHRHRRSLPDLHPRRVAQRARGLSCDVSAGDARQERMASLASVRDAREHDRRRHGDRRELARVRVHPAEQLGRGVAGEGDPLRAGISHQTERE